MAVNVRLTPYYQQVFERKYKITADNFCGQYKDSWNGRQKCGEDNQSELNR